MHLKKTFWIYFINWIGGSLLSTTFQMMKFKKKTNNDILLISLRNFPNLEHDIACRFFRSMHG